jgi:hypothetical protein
MHNLNGLISMTKKIVIGVLLLLLVIGIGGTFWGPSIANASSGLWNSCPKGKVNDPYPGDCRLYIDTNNDEICDRSQSNPAAAIITTSPVSNTKKTPIVTSPTVATPAAAITASANDTAPKGNGSYYFLPIALVTLALYCATWILSARKTIKTLTHRKLWNVVMLVTMAGSTLLGLVRILVKDYSMDISLPFNVLFWHVEISIVLGVVGLFHIIWHWRYFTKMLGMGKNSES